MNTSEEKLNSLWNDIPIGKENAVTYADLIAHWGKKAREVRRILHDLSLYDNGDDLILVRSGSGKGFYRTDDPETISAYRRECLNKGKSIFAPVKKINRVLNADGRQMNFFNNMRAMREKMHMKQPDVCAFLQSSGQSVDVPMLSKMENGVCMPTPFQLQKLAELYGCETFELIGGDLY